MSASGETVELEITPFPPDTVASIKQELVPVIESTLHQAGHDDLLTEKQITWVIEKPFPTDQAIIVGLSFASGVALEIFKQIILPELKRRWKVRQRTKAKASRKLGKR